MHWRRLQPAFVFYILLSLTSLVQASDSIYDIKIKAQPLAKAISDLAEQTKHIFLAPSDIIPNKISPNLVGRYSIPEALSILLSGSELSSSYTQGMIIITQKNSPTNIKPAQTPSNNTQKYTEEIFVRGYRNSLGQSQKRKRHEVVSSEALYAEDISNFPNLNLGDAIKRVSGTVVERDNGEARQIGIRGLSPLFSRTQINGIEALATVSSAFDHRGEVNRSRTFDFNIFPSEIFKQVIIEKSYQASLDEGGISGTINLLTPKPFDFIEQTSTVTLKAISNNYSQKTSPGISGLLSQRWQTQAGELGALVSLTHNQSTTIETGHRDWGWQELDISNKNSLEGQSERIIAPRVAGYTTVNRELVRLGSTGSLQWSPNEQSLFTFDTLYSKIRVEDYEYNLANVEMKDIDNYVVDSHNTVTYAEFLDASVRSESKHSIAETKFYMLALSSELQLNDHFSFNTVSSLSSSKFRSPLHDKIFLQSEAKQLSFDYRGSRRTKNTYDFDLTDSSEWQLHRADAREDFTQNTFFTFESNGHWKNSASSSIDFGVQLKLYEASGYERRDDLRDLSNLNISFHSLPLQHRTDAVFTVVDIEKTFPFILDKNLDGRITHQTFSRDLGTNANRPGTNFKLAENTFAAFSQHNFSFGNIRGNIGLRWLRTEVESLGFSIVTSEENNAWSPIETSNAYSFLLPAFNSVMDITDNFLIRLSANKNISRPNIADLSAAANVDIAGASIIVGNPELDPFLANSYELSTEYYFDDLNYLAFSIFTKSIQSYIVTNTKTMPYEETGLPKSLLTEDRQDQNFEVIKPQNSRGGAIHGFEISFQTELPKGFGIRANYTHTKGKTEYIFQDKKVSAPLLGLSKNSYNLTSYYEKKRWGARVSITNRDRYLTETDSVNYFNGVNASTFVDCIIYFQINSKLKASLEGINVTDEDTDNFSGIEANRPLVNTKSGPTVQLSIALNLN